MPTLPQLLEEDIRVFDASLDDFLSKSEASSALILDKGGFIIGQRGDVNSFDTTTLGALAAAAYAATQGIAGLVQETSFSSVYQQGETYSLLVNDIDEHCLLVAIFRAQISVGAVKYYAMGAINQIARQLQVARNRSPDEGIDLSILNLADAADMFAKRTDEPAPSVTQNLDLQPLFAKKGAHSATEQAPDDSSAEEEDPVAKLQKIKKLLVAGLISEEDFEFKKRRILEQM
jgi:predicted regulator of Ras-like GTPase activity (Roadblock/LC7/MglB family)